MALVAAAGCETPTRLRMRLAAHGFVAEDAEWRVFGNWSRDHGHGLAVELWEQGAADRYSLDISTERRRAAEVAAAICRAGEHEGWDFVSVLSATTYDLRPLGRAKVVGIAQMVWDHEALAACARAGGEAATLLDTWSVRRFFKDAPDGSPNVRIEERR